MNLENIIPQLSHNKLAIYWLRNGVISLALAGVYSIILVMIRTPMLVNLFPNTEIFKSALVIHVNLSILVWLMSVTACIWSYNLQPTTSIITYVILAFFGTALIALSPLCGQNFPVMNNYIPMLENIIFILGISLFGVSVLLFALYPLWNCCKISYFNSLINFTILSTVIMWVLVWVCFIWSYCQLQEIIKLVPVDIEFYYELLFWSGGHLLYDIIDAEFKEYYTKQMKYGGGIAPVLSLIVMFYELKWFHSHESGNDIKGSKDIREVQMSLVKTAIICSSILFLSGGFIGILITGMNVTIPAHYHGSIGRDQCSFYGFLLSSM